MISVLHSSAQQGMVHVWCGNQQVTDTLHGKKHGNAGSAALGYDHCRMDHFRSCYSSRLTMRNSWAASSDRNVSRWSTHYFSDHPQALMGYSNSITNAFGSFCRPIFASVMWWKPVAAVVIADLMRPWSTCWCIWWRPIAGVTPCLLPL